MKGGSQDCCQSLDLLNREDGIEYFPHCDGEFCMMSWFGEEEDLRYLLSEVLSDLQVKISL